MRPSASPEQELVVLGAGMALPDRDRDNACLVWSSPVGSVLLDCGGRAYQQLLRAGVPPENLRALVLTHDHPDHIYGLPALVFQLWLSGYPRELEVYANPSTLRSALRLCDALELRETDHMCRIHWRELAGDAPSRVSDNDSYSIDTFPVRHSRPALGIKITDRITGSFLVYSSDTEPCTELEQQARGVHTLIHEATVPTPESSGHTTPRQAGEIARRCGAGRLVLIHFSAEHTMSEEAALREAGSSGFKGPVRIARELDRYHLAPLP